jgi:glutamate carboxypeptidase
MGVRGLPPHRRATLLALVGLAAALVVLTPAAPADEGLSPEERRVADYVDGHRERAVSLLEQVVNIESATLNLAGVRKVGEVFRREFERLGFETRWVEMPETMRRAGHLVAEGRGTRGKRLLLIGHLDTVVQGRRFERKGNRAAGAGTEDMKGGDVVIVSALEALHSVGALRDCRITVVLTGDEEDAGMPTSESRRALLEAASRSDAALAFEGLTEGTATVARRGASTWTLRVTGQAGHSSGIFGDRLGGGAVFEAARILDAFRKQVPEKYLTLNPSVVVGGSAVSYDADNKRGTAEGKLNVVPSVVVVEGDLRFISEAQKQAARVAMRRIASQNLPRTAAALSFSDEYPSMSPTAGNGRLLVAYSRASRDLGLGEVKPLDPGRRGAGDVSFVAPVLDALDGLGAGGEGAHTRDEWVVLDTLAPQAKRAAVLIYRLTRP